MHRDPIPPAALYCHLTAFKKRCRALVTGGRCDMWRSRTVMDPAGETFVAFDCLDKWKAQFASDQAQGLAQLGAAVESTRNQVLALAGYPDGVPGALPPRNPYRNEADPLELEDAR